MGFWSHCLLLVFVDVLLLLVPGSLFGEHESVCFFGIEI